MLNLLNRPGKGNDKIFFVHWPSCGGTTFWSILRELYGKPNVRRFQLSGTDQRSFLQTQISDPGTQRRPAVGGHVHYANVAEPFAGRRFITFLRDPVDRAISVYHRKIRNQKWTADDAKGDFDIVDFWRGRLGRTHAMHYFAPPGAERATVDQVVEVLTNEFACFGLMEQFDESLHLMTDALGWPRVPVYVQRNIGGNKKRVTPQPVRDALSEILADDVAVVEAMRSVWRDRWAAHPASRDPAIMERYRAAKQKKSERTRLLNLGRDPYVKK